MRDNVNNYIYNFDYLKIVAATFIVFHHYQQITGVSFNLINFYGGAFSFGNLVEFFFLISGFLTEYTFQNNIVTAKWFFHKVLRFFPYTFIATLFALFIALIYYLISGKALLNVTYDTKTIFTSLTLLHTGWFWEFSPAVNNPTWYLCVLLLCYVLFYYIKMIVATFSDFTSLFIFSILSLFSGIVYYFCSHYSWNLPFLHLSNCRGYAPFFLGVLLCILFKITRSSNRNHFVFITVICWFMFFFGVYIKCISNWYVLTYALFPAILCTLLIIPQFTNKFFSTLGSVSFEVYIWHVPLMSLFITICYAVCGGGRGNINHSYLTMLIFGGIVWLFSLGIYFYIEKPLGLFFKKMEKLL